MNYEIKIVRKVINPEYKPPTHMGDIMNYRYDVPQYSVFEALTVELTDEQFEAVKKAVLETF